MAVPLLKIAPSIGKLLVVGLVFLGADRLGARAERVAGHVHRKYGALLYILGIAALLWSFAKAFR